MNARFLILGCLASLAAASAPSQAAPLETGCTAAAKASFARSHPRSKVEVLGIRTVHDARLKQGQKGYYVTIAVGSARGQHVYDAYCTGATSAARGDDPRIEFVRKR